MGKSHSKQQVDYFRPRLISFNPPRHDDEDRVKVSSNANHRFSLRVSEEARLNFRDDQRIDQRKNDAPKSMNKSSSVRSFFTREQGGPERVNENGATNIFSQSVLLVPEQNTSNLNDRKSSMSVLEGSREFSSGFKFQSEVGKFYDPEFKIKKSVPEKLLCNPELLKYKPTGRKIAWTRPELDSNNTKEMKRSSSFLLHRNESILSTQSHYNIMRTSVEAINNSSPKKRCKEIIEE
jgi:hypothetical protein